MSRRRRRGEDDVDREHDAYLIAQAEDAYEPKARPRPRELDPLDRDPGDLEAMASEAEQDAERRWPAR